MSRLRLLLVLLFLVAARIEAAWEVVGSEPLGAPEGISFSHRKLTGGDWTVDAYVVSFSPKTHSFAVLDNPSGDFTLGTAARKRGVAAAVNGGYFHADRTPLGLVIRQGTLIHGIERAKLLSGMVVVTAKGVSLQRPGEFKASSAITHALQAGPFLVDRGVPVAGLEASRSAARTLVFVDDGGRAGLMICRSATLAEMAQILVTPGIVGDHRVVRALNLDGGSSTGLWVAGSPEFYQREGKEVRNYLGIVAR